MKKKILLSFSVLLLIFLGGSMIAVTYLTKTTHRMDALITLHQVELLREDLIIRVQQVQSHLYRKKARSGGEADALIAQVREMDRVMDSCGGCHHSPELTQGLLGMRDMANDYKNAINRLVSASGNPGRIASLERRAQNLGQELITMTQGMAFAANIRLQEKTRETMATIQKVRNVLYLTLLLGFLLAFVIAFLLVKGLDRQLQKLLGAISRVSQGKLQHMVDVRDAQGSEFRGLGEAFNAMTKNLQLSQRQLVQSARLAAIGELATNIAYEVNKPLTGVLRYAGLLLKADDVSADKKEHLKAIERETLHARDILQDLLEFSRRESPRLVKTDISEIIQETISMVKGQAGLSNVELVAACPAGLPPAAMDIEEMKQVFVNLITNAFFAMPKGGTLTIRCREGKDVSGEEIVAVELIDTGPGIPEEQLDRIFDPFLTTRTDGDRTGLGMSVNYMIVRNHGGRIEVESKVGTGSTFRVILPVLKRVDAPEAHVEEQE